MADCCVDVALRWRHAPCTSGFDEVPAWARHHLSLPNKGVVMPRSRLAPSPARALRPHHALAAISLAVLQLGAAAQTTGQLQTITVTAERRVENIREVPSSVSALQGETLDVINSSGQDVRALSGRVPSLNIESSFGRAFPRFYLRGYGNTDFRANASQPVSLVYDDVVQESPLLKGFPMFDLDQVEVLAGPQGSLFGRNTPAGVVKFDSAKPRIGASDGYASLSFGTYKTTNLEAAKSVPISSELSARVSVLAQYRDNWVHNTLATGPTQDMEGYKDNATRVQLLYKPRADFSALFNVHARDLHGTARVFRANIFKQGTNDLVDGFDASKVSLDGRNEQSIQIVGSNARLSWDLGGLSLYSITGYETVHSYSRGDIDGGSSPYIFGGAGTIHFPSETAGGLHGHHQLTQEFRVESHSTGPLNWQAGVYYFNEDFISNSFGYNSLAGGAQSSLLTDQQKSTSWAGFGSLKYDVSPDFSLRAGLRYTKDTKNLNSDATAGVNLGNGTTAHLSDSKPTADLSALYKLDRDTNVYARVATGYRGSSVEPASAFGPQSLAGQESTVSYEAGVKADLLNRRARVALSVFHYDVKDLQLTEVGGGGNTNTLKTAKKAVGQGVELSLNAYVTDSLLVSLSGSINDTQIKDPSLTVSGCGSNMCTMTNRAVTAGQYSIDGNPLPQAPKYVANANARYSIPVSSGEFFVFTDWSYRSKVNFFLYEAKEFTGKALLEGGLRVGYNWGAGKYEVAAFGRNITNKVVAVGAIDFNNLTGFINDPRTFGVQFKAQF
jgi:iron complex outermembrane receptor protein